MHPDCHHNMLHPTAHNFMALSWYGVPNHYFSFQKVNSYDCKVINFEAHCQHCLEFGTQLIGCLWLGFRPLLQLMLRNKTALH